MGEILSNIDFDAAFAALTGNEPFPWQRALYGRFLIGDFPSSCNLPTGLGKTSVVAVWLIALAARPTAIPRRLVYVVNRRTVVDQTTDEVEKYRRRLGEVGPPAGPELAALVTRLLEMSASPERGPLAISTLRGQFADNREWSADPSRPAVVVGTVDMIGSRLLFGGYGIGFKTRPLHAGFLGQDALLVHDEAHLEPAFQDLLVAIECEQRRCKEFRPFRVMELSATPRGDGDAFPDEAERESNQGHPVVRKRTGAKKALHLHALDEKAKWAEKLTERARQFHESSGPAVLVFARTVDAVERIAADLRKDKLQVETLTGTLRGLERDGLVKKPIFQRFLPPSNRDADVSPTEGTVYLVCTSAGEVGVNISADHLVSDLSTFESMAQRFGRVNRFGERDDTRIDVFHATEFDKESEYELRLQKTLVLMELLKGAGSPNALTGLDAKARAGAFAPPPTTLPVSDILFDAWALTTIRERLPGRPPVEPYLHGLSEWQPPETQVAWREEVGLIVGEELLAQHDPADLLEDYPLKPHELLRDNSSRVFDRLKKLKALPETPVWLYADEEAITVTTLGGLIEGDKENLERKTLLLPPNAGGLENGLFTSSSQTADDVADRWFDDKGRPRRLRLRGNDEDFEGKTKEMRSIRRIDFPVSEGDEEAEDRAWYWFERTDEGDGEGSKANKKPVLWQDHTDDVVRNAAGSLDKLPLDDGMKAAVRFAAECHDLGKRRPHFQHVLGNWKGQPLLAKSGTRSRASGLREEFRHEFGSLVDVLDEAQTYSAKFLSLSEEMREVVLHLIAAHHGHGRPHFTAAAATHPANGPGASRITTEVPRRFARLQRKYGRWGLAYLESLLRAADYAASARPSKFWEGQP